MVPELWPLLYYLPTPLLALLSLNANVLPQSPRTSSAFSTMDLADCTLRHVPSELGHVRSIEVANFSYFLILLPHFAGVRCIWETEPE